MTRKLKRPTTTSLIVEALKAQDDFMTAAMLRAALRESNANRITAALHHLRRHRVVDCMESDGQLWWYLTIDTDQRIRTHEEIVETYVKPNRRRRKEN